ncbi:hypothetical protein PR202_gb12719 [Eleusine coracana subsp. coracana]|uniref:Uncharacterized protein n=1 Tax=Eleusine coracana subsp. coracana TaxID=191504 RepID=A0AAV5ERQ0_ELECO|nr:hypothetical protein PR202_gb12719 [Eleusine coracana subsp. coracana]
MPPVTAASGGGRQATSGEAPVPSKRPLHSDDSGSGSSSDGDGDSESEGYMVSDLREIVSLLRLIKGGGNKDDQKMCQQIIASRAECSISLCLLLAFVLLRKYGCVAEDIQTMLEETQMKFEKERYFTCL